MTAPAIGILAVGAYAPATTIPNAHYAARLDTTDEWIVSRSGIRERRFASDTEFTSTLGVKAVQDMLARDPEALQGVDLVIYATCTPDAMFPSTAALVAGQVGLAGVGAYDLSTACSGFVYGLSMARGMILGGSAQRVLVLGGGDGMAVREILKYPSVESVTLVELDPASVRTAGSDPASMLTTARQEPGGDWVLNGSKRWIGLGTIADVAIVWAQTGESGDGRGVRGFVVPTDTPGFSAPEIKKKLSLRASVTGEIVLDDPASDRAHPAFSKMFVRTEIRDGGAGGEE